MSVALKLGGGSGAFAPTADPQDYNYIGEWAGQDSIKKVTIYLVDDNPSVPVQSDELIVTSAYTYSINGSRQVELKPTKDGAIKTSPGKKTVYVVINETQAVKDHLNTPYPVEFVKRYTETALVLENSGYNATVATAASKLANSTADATGFDNIVMTNVPGTAFTVEVKEGVSADETTAATGYENRAAVTVERTVARVMITTKQTSYPVVVDGSTIGTITDITWTLAQGETALYVQRKADWKTPEYNWVAGVTNDYYDGTNGIDGAWGRYDYSGLRESSPVPTLADYADLVSSGVVDAGFDSKAMDGRFLLATTHLSDADKDVSGYRKGNTPYVLVRTKFAPANFEDAGTAPLDGTFYYGGYDHKFYTSAQAAYDAGNLAISKYDAGKTIYYAWVNPDQLPNWVNSPVLRNNIYHIHVTGFRNLGLNWNPLFPENPNDPSDPSNPNPKDPLDPNYDPKDPDQYDNPDPKVPVEPVDDGGTPVDPVDPVDPEDPLTPEETWMSVDVTILPWLVHSYEVDLGI